MRNDKIVKVTAVIIREEMYKEYDKLFTLFTKELGKIRAYAFGVRREHSKKIGMLRLFSFCEIELESSSDLYTIKDVHILDSLDDLSGDYDAMCYASYFAELVDYCSFENMESEDIFKLLYYTYKALIKNVIDKKLIKSIFELKLLKYQGEYIESSALKEDNESLRYTWDYCINSDIKDLYKFNLTDDLYKLFKDAVDSEFRLRINKKFKSLDKISL